MNDPHQQEARKACYRAVSAIFEQHQHDVAEIEILPPAICPPEGQVLLQDGNSIGIPKKVLRLAFIEACVQFARRNKHNALLTSLDQKMWLATAVILLHDPEHLSAANWRKRSLVELNSAASKNGGELQCETKGHGGLIVANLRREFALLDTILTSPLHRQSKSPTLWHHRMWLVSTFRTSLIGMSSGELASPADTIISEFGIVVKAAERHPCNYYAWQYARRLLEWWYVAQKRHGSEEGICRSTATLNMIGKKTLEWCLKHPSDVSGWSFLAYLLQERGVDDGEVWVKDVLNFATTMQWRKEALWSFLTQVTTEGDVVVHISKGLSEKVSRARLQLRPLAQGTARRGD